MNFSHRSRIHNTFEEIAALQELYDHEIDPEARKKLEEAIAQAQQSLGKKEQILKYEVNKLSMS